LQLKLDLKSRRTELLATYVELKSKGQSKDKKAQELRAAVEDVVW
jgi:orotate phosphoribosyltransferase-like protein